MNIRHHIIARQIRARPRLASAALTGAAAAILIPHSVASHTVTRLILGWNVGACLYLLLAGMMMARSTHDQIRHRARMQDEGQSLILLLVAIASIASLGAIVAELATAKDLTGTLKYEHIGLAAFTILSSWAFTHLMFALHYAHDYYVACTNLRPAGLDFPGTASPDYLDFLYLACVIGTSGQTADVSFSSGEMRRIGLLHCVLAFLFNTTLLALTINIAASLF
jgi:uncharacterized membrane protein